ncbi:MAG: D-aminoacylase [Gammaproteobacteria bacterium]|nr:D-aminoacylase [Gammaproteobacteria bacterium]
MSAWLLYNAQIIDGNKRVAFQGDVCVEHGRITAVGYDLPVQNAQIIDCTGLVLCPGFIDTHTHDDAQVLRDPGMVAKLSQGITTVITGNCGLSLVPLVTPIPPSPLDLLHSEAFAYASVNDYRAAIERARPSVNVAMLIGHSSLRIKAMTDLERPANAQETESMCYDLEQAMQQGAMGLSSGLFYATAKSADVQEMQALVRVVGRYGGIYATHLRSEMDSIIDAMHEAASTAQAGCATWILSHHKCAGPANWGRSVETLALLEILEQKQEIALDAYPYTAGSTLLREDLVDGQIDILITRSQPHPECTGRMLKDIAKEWQMSEQEACCKLSPGGACYFQMREDDVQRILCHPLTMIGSDGLPHDEKPHPRLWGTFPRVLGHYCRDLELMSLPEAIHKMTGLPAQRLRLKNRGQVAPGYYADLVLFDPQKIQDKATYATPTTPCEGIHRVMVRGDWAWINGQATGQGKGEFLAFAG